MSEMRRNEKYEKVEKQEEKDEKERQEKNWDEKWRRDPLSAAGWAAVLIWAGIVLLLENLGLLGALTLAGRPPVAGAWSLIVTGAGLIVLLLVLVRVLVPAYRRPVMGSLILGFILLAVGLGDILGTGVVWAVLLIFIGVVMLLRGMLRGR